MKSSKVIEGQKNTRPRVLLIGPVHPKGGGVGMVNHILLTCGLSNYYDIKLLDTGRTKAGEGHETHLAPINLYYYISQLARLFWLLLVYRPQIVHQAATDRLGFFKDTSFLLISRIFGAKTVSHMHGCILDVEIEQAGLFHKWLIKQSLFVPHQIIVLSQYWYSFLHQKISPSLNIVIIPNCVDDSIASAMEQPVSDVDSGCNVLALGWLGRRKGLFDALKAARLVHVRNPSIRFVFAGGLEPGITEEVIQQATVAEGVEDIVSYPGLVTGNAKLNFLKNANIFILPSYNENLPVSILEGMAMGLPIVATKIAGIPEIVQEGCNGYLINPGDFNALAECILRLAADSDLRQKMGRANFERVKIEYHPEVFKKHIMALYLKLLGG